MSRDSQETRFLLDTLKAIRKPKGPIKRHACVCKQLDCSFCNWKWPFNNYLMNRRITLRYDQYFTKSTEAASNDTLP